MPTSQSPEFVCMLPYLTNGFGRYESIKDLKILELSEWADTNVKNLYKREVRGSKQKEGNTVME